MATSPSRDKPAFEPLHHLTARSPASSHPRSASHAAGGGPVGAAVVLPLPPGVQPCLLVESACGPQPHRRCSSRSIASRRSSFISVLVSGPLWIPSSRLHSTRYA